MIQTYDVIEASAAPLLYVYIFLSTFSLFMLISIAYKWLQRRNIISLYITLSYLMFTMALIGLTIGLRDALITGEKRELYRFSLGFAYTTMMVANLFFLKFSGMVFGLKQHFLKKYYAFGIILAIALALPWNYYGYPDAEIPAWSIRLYTSIAMVVYSLFIYIRLFFECRRVKRLVSKPWAKKGFSYLSLSLISISMIYICFSLDTLLFTFTAVTGYSAFLYIGWFMVSFYLVFSYLGFVMPAHWKSKAENTT